MTNKNQVTLTPNVFYGYIDDSTPCGRAKAKQVKADMETLTTMLNDTNLTEKTKKAIYLDYSKAIKEYVEREETCCDCTNDCDCEEEEEEWEEEEDEEEEWEDEEEEEEIPLKGVVRYLVKVGGQDFYCDDYEETIDLIQRLDTLRFDNIEVFGYTKGNEGIWLTIIDDYGDFSLKI